MGTPSRDKDEKDIEQRRDEILKRMHKLPPKPNKDYVGDSKSKSKDDSRKRQSGQKKGT